MLSLIALVAALGATVAVLVRNGAGGRRSPATGSVPTHIPTWAYDDGCSGGAGAPASLVRRWVTYAESNCGPNATKVLSDCHSSATTYCAAVQYLDASKIYRSASVPIALDARENWWLHVRGHRDAAHRVAVPEFGGGDQLDQANPAVGAWFRRYVRANHDSYDALMTDDTAASLKAQFGAVPTDEIRTDDALRAAHEQLARALTHTDGTPFLQIDNGITANPYLPSATLLLDRPAAVRGLIDEGEPENNGRMPNPRWGYPTLLDEMAEVDHTADDFEVLLGYDLAGSLQSRRVQATTVLLGYAAGHTVSWSNLERQSKNLAVWPEEGIVPGAAVQSMSQPGGAGCLAGSGAVCATGGHNDLEVSPGVYRREFSTCYDEGVSFGPCAAIVNSTSSPVTVSAAWLEQSYGHEITMSGGDVQSGGRLDLTGSAFTAGSTTVAPEDALLLAGR